MCTWRESWLSRVAVGAVLSLDHSPFKKPIVTVLIQNNLQKLVNK